MLVKIENQVTEQVAKTILPRSERLSLFKEGLLKAASQKNHEVSLDLINKTLDNIENAHSAVKDRMFGIIDNKYVTYHSNGSATALA